MSIQNWQIEQIKNDLTTSSNMASIIGSYGAIINILLEKIESGQRFKTPVPDYAIEHANRALAVGEFVWENRDAKQWNLKVVDEAYKAWGKDGLSRLLYEEDLYPGTMGDEASAPC
jgi:hypothetical protein